MLITPGVDEGGRYSFVVSASRVTSRQSYRLQAGLAGLDDQFPGQVLPNQRRVRGTLNARALDAVDVYRFDYLLFVSSLTHRLGGVCRPVPNPLWSAPA